MKLINKDAIICDAPVDCYGHQPVLTYTLKRTAVKEVGLDKEFSQWWKDERTKDYNADILYERYSNISMKLAKHFYELGLNAKTEK